LAALLLFSLTSWSAFADGARSSLDFRAPGSDEPAFSMSLEYAQSARAWETLGDIQGAQGNLSAIDDILHRDYGTFEESFGRFDVGVSGIRTPIQLGAFRRAYFGASAEAIGTGIAENPVVPELHATALAGGSLSAGFATKLGERGPSLSYGLTAGAGSEKRVDAYSTDVIDSIPVRTGSYTLVGADFAASHSVSLGSRADLKLGASERETLFLTTVPAAALGAGADTQLWTHRWRLDAEPGSTALTSGHGRAFAQLIAGPQPLPVDCLPRVWDYVHALDPFPELGALVGAGGGWETAWGARSRLRLAAGFYGGYVGAGLEGRFGAFTASAGSWGIEGSSAYQTMGSRIWSAALGLAL
jgi:hypothetical protein